MKWREYVGKQVHFSVYCDETDLRYAYSFLDPYITRIVATEYNGQYLSVYFDMEGVLKEEAPIVLDRIKAGISECIRRHKKSTQPPPRLTTDFPPPPPPPDDEP